MEGLVLLVDYIEDAIVERLFQVYGSTLSYYNDDLDHGHFNEWIPNQLFDDFKITSLETLRPLPDDDRRTFLTESLRQFETRTPEKRIDAIYLKYAKSCSLGVVNPKINKDDKRRVNHALKAYKKHFRKFKAYSSTLLSDLNNGTLNVYAHIFGDEEPEPVPVDVSKNAVNPLISWLESDAKDSQSKENQEQVVQSNPVADPSPDPAREAYLQDWLNCRVTLDQWLASPYKDVSKKIASLAYPDEESSMLPFNHMSNLYNEYVERRTKSLIEILQNELNLNIRLIHARKDFHLIDNLIQGEINHAQARSLFTNFEIEDWEVFHQKIDDFFSGNIDPFSACDLQDEYNFSQVEIILKYHEYLGTLIKSQDIKQSFKTKKYKDINALSVNPLIFNEVTQNVFNKKLRELVSYLIDKDLVEKQPNLERRFINIFSNTKINVPVKWIDGNESFSYFIKQLHKNKILLPSRANWQVTITLFNNEDGAKFTASGLQHQKVPAAAKKKLIDDAIRILM